MTTGEPYTHTSNPLCERQNPVLEQNLRIQMKQEHAKDCVRLLPWAVINMKSQESSSTGYTPDELFHGGRPAWFFKTPFPVDYKSTVGDWLDHRPPTAANPSPAPLRSRPERQTCTQGLTTMRQQTIPRPAPLRPGTEKSCPPHPRGHHTRGTNSTWMNC